MRIDFSLNNTLNVSINNLMILILLLSKEKSERT